MLNSNGATAESRVMTVSFIIPVHNVAPYLPECLDSILMQSLTDYEVILVNNGSTDDSLAVCEAFAGQHDNVRVLDLAESGVSLARNEGVKVAKGEYICFLDADDYYIADFAGEFYRRCKENDLDMIRGVYCIFDEESGEYRHKDKLTTSYDNTVISGREFLVNSAREQTNEVVPWLGFFKTSFLREHELAFPVGIAYEEDQIFFLRALLADGCRAMQVPTEFYAYRQRIGSATKTPTLKQAQDVGFIVDRELELARSVQNKTVRRAAKCYAGSSFYQMTCIYGRVPKEQRRAIRRISSFRTKLSCSLHAVTKHQRMKNALFTFFPWLVGVVYDLRKRK